MAATGDEMVTLGQLKEWSDTLGGGGFSPATSEVTIIYSGGDEKTIRYMGVDGSYTYTMMGQEKLRLEVPIMSMIMVLNSTISVGEGGLNLMTAIDQYVTLVMDTSCVIRIIA